MPSASDQRRGGQARSGNTSRQETKRRVSRVRPQNFPQYLNVDWGAPRRGIALVHVGQETTEPLGTLEHKGTSCKEVVPSSGVERQRRARCGKMEKNPCGCRVSFPSRIFFFFFNSRCFMLLCRKHSISWKHSGLCPRVPQDPYWSHPRLMTGCFSRLG